MILVGVLLGHAGVGVTCLVRGRTGFEAILVPWLHWTVLIMSSCALLVMTELALQLRRKDAAERACWLLGAMFVLTSLGVGVWLVSANDGREYDRLAGAFSNALGANVDPTSGAVFAGIPWLGLAYVACLAGYAVVSDQQILVSLSSTDNAQPALRNFCRGLVIAVALLAFVGVLHFATGARW